MTSDTNQIDRQDGAVSRNSWPGNQGDQMDFGEAIRHMKLGRKVAREGWNGKGMFVFEGLARVEINAKVDGYLTGQDAAEVLGINYEGPTLCMKTSKETIVVGWLASQTDMLAEDWFVVNEA